MSETRSAQQGAYTAVPPPVALQSVERAISDLRRGAIVVVVGNGHALVVQAAEGVTREALARVAALSKGTPSLLLTARRAAILGLTNDPKGAVRISLSGGITADTVRMMADPAGPQPEQQPAALSIALIDRDTKPGAAELGAIELAKLARLLPAAVVAAVPAERLGYLPSWADTESLLVVDLDNIHQYRDAEARTLQRVGEATVPLSEAENTNVIAFRPPDGGREHLAIVIGTLDLDAPVLVRIHSECFTGDLLGSLRCDCGDQLRGAVAEINKAGSGVLLYMAQEGRGIGLVNKLRAYELQDQGFDTIDANEQLGFDPDERIYLPAAEILRQLGISKVRLLTNNPQKVSALAEGGIEVSERVPHAFPSNQHSERYLATKQNRGGHLL
ncbi:MAG: GTP cyclohydrolase II [Alphaproteobacteria bacterium]|nr:GTP cyclohydrolase II [Alphaproteobacteria bacterium]